MARCLVTGGAGFIGSHLVERLLEMGHDVVVLDDLSTGRRENLAEAQSHPRLSFQSGSITDNVALGLVMPGIDVVYHLAAAVGVKLVADDPVRTIETNIYPTEMLLQMAAQGKQRVFLASTSEVYGKNPKEEWTEEDDLHLGPTSRPRWAYGCSKAIDEFLCSLIIGSSASRRWSGGFSTWWDLGRSGIMGWSFRGSSIKPSQAAPWWFMMMESRSAALPTSAKWSIAWSA